MPLPNRAILVLIAAVAACGRPPGDRPKAQYDPVTGRLRVLAYDADRDGRNDAVSYMDGTRIRRIELDLDGNGKVERWDFYGADGMIEKVGLSQRNDGVMDAQAFYTGAGALQRIEISTTRNDRYDRIEFYEANRLTRSEEDTNADGKPDKWETYRSDPSPLPGVSPYAIASTAFDDTGSGRPERRFLYGPDGAVAQVEVDPEGDGTWQARRPPLGTPSTPPNSRDRVSISGQR